MGESCRCESAALYFGIDTECRLRGEGRENDFFISVRKKERNDRRIAAPMGIGAAMLLATISELIRVGYERLFVFDCPAFACRMQHNEEGVFEHRDHHRHRTGFDIRRKGGGGFDRMEHGIWFDIFDQHAVRRGDGWGRKAYL